MPRRLLYVMVVVEASRPARRERVVWAKIIDRTACLLSTSGGVYARSTKTRSESFDNGPMRGGSDVTQELRTAM